MTTNVFLDPKTDLSLRFACEVNNARKVRIKDRPYSSKLKPQARRVLKEQGDCRSDSCVDAEAERSSMFILPKRICDWSWRKEVSCPRIKPALTVGVEMNRR